MVTQRVQQLQRAAAAALDSRKLTAGSSAAAGAGLLGGHISARSAAAGTAGSPARMQVCSADVLQRQLHRHVAL